MKRNIVFDVGEVLFSYRWIDALAETGIPYEEAQVIGPQMFESPYWPDLDLGNGDYFELAREIAKEYPKYENEIMKFFTDVDNLYISRPRVWDEVERLKAKGYRLYILSNYPSYMFEKHTKDKAFMKCMDGILVSYMVHLNKPNPEMYQELFRRFEIKPEESLYFDDKKENTDMAVSLGMDSVTVMSEEHLLTELAKL